MGNRKPLLITAVALVLLIALAFVAYGALSESVGSENMGSGGQVASGTGDEAADGAGDAGGEAADGQAAGGDSSQGSDQAERQLMPAPDFTVLDADGQSVSLSSLKGKPVVVNFWTSLCTICKQEMPDFQAVYEEYGDRVHFMMVNATADARESKAQARAFIAEHDYTFPHYFDVEGDALVSYAVRSYPVTYLVDADGNLAGYAAGGLDRDTLAGALEELL